ncbi:hypothetical protein MASR1M46_08230 [Bacteroidales bacterium]
MVMVYGNYACNILLVALQAILNLYISNFSYGEIQEIHIENLILMLVVNGVISVKYLLFMDYYKHSEE